MGIYSNYFVLSLLYFCILIYSPVFYKLLDMIDRWRFIFSPPFLPQSPSFDAMSFPLSGDMYL